MHMCCNKAIAFERFCVDLDVSDSVLIQANDKVDYDLNLKETPQLASEIEQILSQFR